MNSQYIRQVHSCVMFKGGIFNEDGLPLVPIIHHVGTHVWVMASYSNNLPADVFQVGDGRSSGFDEDGNNIVSVPVSYVEGYCLDEEADAFFQAHEDDMQLLSYAR